uniref:Uncharacterized protein n=1 Tax=viral metagenome TaxID=1070528 RepID=A0A6M3XLH9_9ZZZZ
MPKHIRLTIPDDIHNDLKSLCTDEHGNKIHGKQARLIRQGLRLIIKQEKERAAKYAQILSSLEG